MNCPLCNEPNDCAMETDAAATDCWCFKQSFPKALLEAISTELKNKACICRNCLRNAAVEHH